VQSIAVSNRPGNEMTLSCHSEVGATCCAVIVIVRILRRLSRSRTNPTVLAVVAATLTCRPGQVGSNMQHKSRIHPSVLACQRSPATGSPAHARRVVASLWHLGLNLGRVPLGWARTIGTIVKAELIRLGEHASIVRYQTSWPALDTRTI